MLRPAADAGGATARHAGSGPGPGPGPRSSLAAAENLRPAPGAGPGPRPTPKVQQKPEVNGPQAGRGPEPRSEVRSSRRRNPAACARRGTGDRARGRRQRFSENRKRMALMPGAGPGPGLRSGVAAAENLQPAPGAGPGTGPAADAKGTAKTGTEWPSRRAPAQAPTHGVPGCCGAVAQARAQRQGFMFLLWHYRPRRRFEKCRSRRLKCQYHPSASISVLRHSRTA